MFFVTKTLAGSAFILGRCRRHAPVMSGFPAVFPTDWCGDHKLDETKVATIEIFMPDKEEII